MAARNEPSQTSPSDSKPPPQYWCHQCSVYIKPSPEFRCPTCGSDFLEIVEQPPQQQPPPPQPNHSNVQPQPGMPTGFAPNGINITMTNMNDNIPTPFLQHLHDLLQVVNTRHHGSPMGFRIMQSGSAPTPFPWLPYAGAPGQDPLNSLLGDPRNYAFGPQFNELLHRLFESSQGRGPPPTSSKFVETLPLIHIDEKLIAEKEECSICKDEFKLQEDVIKLPCRHMFHVDCIKPWLAMHNTCPSCRHEMPTDDPEYEAKRKQQQQQHPHQ